MSFEEFIGFAFATRPGPSQVGRVFPVGESKELFPTNTGKFVFIIWGNKVNVIEMNDDVTQLCDILCGFITSHDGEMSELPNCHVDVWQ